MNKSLRRAGMGNALLALGCLALAVPLALYAWTGSNMRYTGDDYCYAGLFRQRGFWETITTTYIGPSPFHGNRFSLTLFSGLAGMVGPAASAALPTLAIGTSVVGLAFASGATARALSLRLSLLESMLASECLVFFTLALAPDLAQSLYWRSGMVPYLLPLVLLTVLGGMMLELSRQDKPPKLRLGIIFALALLAGGFSETAAALQFTALALALLSVLIVNRRSRQIFPWAPQVVASALVGSALGLVLLAASPFNKYALEGLETTVRVTELLRMTLFHTYLFLHGLAFRQWLPALALFFVFFWLTLKVARRRAPNQTASWRQLAPGLILLMVVWIALIVATMLPSAYAQSSYPVARALITSMFASTLAVAGSGLLAGYYAAGRFPSDPLTQLTASVLFICAVTITPLSASRSAWVELPRYQRWAEFWDARDRQIREMRSRGDSEVEVVLMDKIIPDVAELQPDPEFWYNNCAEWYYDLDRLSANLPGWD